MAVLGSTSIVEGDSMSMGEVGDEPETMSSLVMISIIWFTKDSTVWKSFSRSLFDSWDIVVDVCESWSWFR